MTLPENLGYPHDLFILPFDHRSTFQEKLLKAHGRKLTEGEEAEIRVFKQIIYEGFQRAIAGGIPKDKAGILVDEQFGAGILRDAKARGFTIAVTTEKSGQDEFDFEYGSEFGEHLLRFQPDFAKVLVRYNPEGDREMNRRQTRRLKLLSDFCHSHGIRLMLELLVVPLKAQLATLGGDSSRYDRELRPNLMCKAMSEIQGAGVEADVWKLEGIESEADARRVVQQAKTAGRDQVGIIILGRGENEEKCRHWLATAARVPGFIGFAVGRTIFWEAIQKFKEGRWSREQASERVMRNYQAMGELWQTAGRESSKPGPGVHPSIF